MKSLPKNTAQFADYFREHTDSYVLIGGVATLYHEEKRTLSASRGTKDLDIVVLDLSEDETTSAFLNLFKQYIKENKYICTPLSGDKNQNFRFSNPESVLAPGLIEIISKRFVPEEQGTQRLEDSEMSAIALSEDFYELAKKSKTTEVIEELGTAGLPVATPTALILLKAFAYQNLMRSDKKDDRSKAPKHLTDIARLAAILTDGDSIIVTTAVYEPLKTILEKSEEHFPPNKTVNLGWKKNTPAAEVAKSITNRIKVG